MKYAFILAFALLICLITPAYSVADASDLATISIDWPNLKFCVKAKVPDLKITETTVTSTDKVGKKKGEKVYEPPKTISVPVETPYCANLEANASAADFVKIVIVGFDGNSKGSMTWERPIAQYFAKNPAKRGSSLPKKK